MKTVAFCEIEKFPQAVLHKHWPDVPIYDDVCQLTAEKLRSDGIGTIDVICGGFPCQDISVAGKRKGLAGRRSGLWKEYVRIINDIRPHYVIVENVTGLLSGARGAWFGEFLTDLAQIGYDAEWECISAQQVGAPHQRQRAWIIAYPSKVRRNNGIFNYIKYEIPAYKEWNISQNIKSGKGWKHWLIEVCKNCDWFVSKSDFCGMDDGLSKELDAIATLGNAVVPQIPEIIGRAIMNSYENRK
jgi:DNA (cytosine-5)-methyltransferase 1